MHATRGIVLSQKERGEADLAVALFTERYGLLRATAQGVRKPNAKLSGHIEPATEAEITFVEGKGGYRLTGSEIREDFSRLRKEEERLKAFLAASVVLETVAFEGEEREVWGLFSAFIRWLNQSRAIAPQELAVGLVWFFTKLLLALGYQMSQNFNSPAQTKLTSQLIKIEEAELGEATRLDISPTDIQALFLAVRTSFETHFGYRFLFLTTSFKG